MTRGSTRVGYMGEFPDFTARGFSVDEYNQRFKEANVIIHAKAKKVYYPPHWGALSLKCCIAGTEYYQSRNAEYAVDPNHYLLFNEGKVYSSRIDSHSDVESFTLSIAPTFEKAVLRSFFRDDDRVLSSTDVKPRADFRFTEKLYGHDSTVTPLLVKIRDLANAVDLNQEQLNESFAALLERLWVRQGLTNLEIGAVQKLRYSTKVELFDRLTRAKDYIYSSYSKEISLEEVADVACLNQFYFLRQFKSVFRLTPHQFLTERRLEVAASLLSTRDKSVTEICSDIGFSDLASFSKLFKRRFGISPLEYRKTKIK